MRFALNQSAAIIGEQMENSKPEPLALAIVSAYRPRQTDKNNSMDTLNLGATLSPVLTDSTQHGERNMNRFDPQDFQQSPRKYEMFKTARTASRVFTENGEHDLAKGASVSIEFLRVAPNRLFRRDEPVYAVRDTSGEFRGYFYANTLADFCL